MRYFILLLFSILNLNSFAQENTIITSSQIRNVMDAADKCAANQNQNCSALYHKAIMLGKKTKQNYMDYLYYKISQYHFNNYKQDSALVYTNLGLAKTTDFESEASLLNLKAVILYNKGDVNAALNIFILLAEKLEKVQDWQKLAYTYTNIGNLFDSQENDQKSLEYLLKSYTILQKTKDTTYITTTIANISEGYYSIKKYELAKKWCHKALKMKDYVKDYSGKIIAYNTLSRIHLENFPDSALIYSQKAIRLSELKNEKLQLGNAYAIYAEALMKKGKFLEAQKAIEKSVEIYREIDFKPGLADNLFAAGTISKRNKLYEKSANFLYESKRLSDSLKSEQRTKIINELNTKYQTEQKEKLLTEQELIIEKEQNQKSLIFTIAVFIVLILLIAFIFYRKNQTAKAQKLIQKKENEVLNAFITGEERERNRISHELHDGIASMIGVAKMNMEALPHLPKETQAEQIQYVIKILENTHADVRHIAHNLLPITLQKEGLIKATQQFANEINKTGVLTISITNQMDTDLEIPEQKQLMIFRMIQELIHNVVKHSQAQNATISFDLNDNNLVIQVTDDGIGIKTEISSENQGLYSIQQRISSILGRFSFNQNNDTNGTTAILEINL